MTGREWRGVVNQILFTLMFTRHLDDRVVEEVARNIVNRGTLRAGPARYYEALSEALGSDAPLTTEIETHHADDEFRDFLRRLRDRLDALRPWPEPRFVTLPPSHWPDFADGRAIGRIELTTMTLANRLRELFEYLPMGDGKQPGLLLRLGSGEEVALLGSYEPGNRVILLQRERTDPARTIAAFSAATGVGPDEIVPITDTEKPPEAK